MHCEQTVLDLRTTQDFASLLHTRGITGIDVRVNPRLRKSWRVMLNRTRSRATLVIPRFLLDAPDPIKHCLIDWACLYLRAPGRRRTPVPRGTKRQLESRIWEYLEHTGHAGAQRSLGDTRIPFTSHGRRYDLRSIFDELNTAYFDDALQALLRWGRYASTTSYHTVMCDTHHRGRNVITIAGVYDHPAVPPFAIRGILHHEMCHIAAPPYTKNGIRRIHTRAFKALEKKYIFHDAWRSWEQRHLHTLVARMKKAHTKKRNNAPRSRRAP
jgi:hypothetical protein